MVPWFWESAEVSVLGPSLFISTPLIQWTAGVTWVPPFQYMSPLQPSLSPSCPSLHSNHFNHHLLNICCQAPCYLLRIQQIRKTDTVPALLSCLCFPSIAHVIEPAFKAFHNVSQTHLLNHSLLCQPTKLEMVTTTWTWATLSCLCAFHLESSPCPSSCRRDLLLWGPAKMSLHPL